MDAGLWPSVGHWIRNGRTRIFRFPVTQKQSLMVQFLRIRYHGWTELNTVRIFCGSPQIHFRQTHATWTHLKSCLSRAKDIAWGTVVRTKTGKNGCLAGLLSKISSRMPLYEITSAENNGCFASMLSRFVQRLSPPSPNFYCHVVRRRATSRERHSIRSCCFVVGAEVN